MIQLSRSPFAFLAVLLILSLGSAPIQAELAVSRGSGPAQGLASPDWVYTLKAGENFQQVARELLTDTTSAQQLASYNRIRTPSALGAGDTLRIPVSWLRQQPEPARVTGLKGDVQARTANSGRLRRLNEGDLIRAGDTVITRDGLATIELADGSVVRINPASSVVFNRLTRYGRAGMTDTRMRLERGAISNRVRPMVEDGSRFEIETPSAIAAVRGTAFALQADAGGSRVQVTEGKVAFGRPGNSRDIPAGYGASLASSGSAELRFHRLPPAPQTLPIPAMLSALPQDFSWEANGADLYQVDIVEADSGRWIRREQTRDNRVALTDLANGEYRLEVSALTGDGISGMPATASIQVDLAARAAALLEPQERAAVDSDQPRFRWKFNGENEQARIEISRTESFNNLVASSTWSPRNSALPDRPLSPGQYYWRVVTEAGGNSVATSETRSLLVNGTLPPVRVISANYIDRQVRIFWESLDNASGYLLQLSEDPSFEEVIKEATVNDTTAALRLIPGRRYFVRLRAVSEGPMAGRWGPGRELFVE
ncbi:FecR family protein [Marinobacter daqiaonensis]|uniref:FecR family protein n=1 Tax=Marinobacter daqiaonensis TaxID=650891 RepID=A0A1I6JFA3_9GAMM|nr:FecR domain-containing protein [Marinobacter daqiaonensis]SFR77713.1 FecR family protein [Marinobacter daqiaonensis]